MIKAFIVISKKQHFIVFCLQWFSNILVEGRQQKPRIKIAELSTTGLPAYFPCAKKRGERPLGQYQMHQHSNYRGPRRREKKKGYEKIIEEIIAENFPNMEKEIVNQVQEVQRAPYGKNQGETHEDMY